MHGGDSWSMFPYLHQVACLDLGIERITLHRSHHHQWIGRIGIQCKERQNRIEQRGDDWLLGICFLQEAPEQPLG